jgi:hypothetical protein
LIGPGHGLTTNLGTPANKLSATISGGTSFVRTSLANAGSANGSLVMSLAFLSELNLDACANVTVARCLFDSGGRLVLAGPSNIVTQCYVSGSGVLGLNTFSTGSRIENSLLLSPFAGVSAGATYTFKNNILSSLSSTAAFLTIDNNIFLSTPGSSFPNTVFRNNLFMSFVPPGITGTGNLALSSPTTIMANYNTSAGVNQLERNYQLLPLSAANPAYNAGTDGTHIGPFGGANPYILSGVPPLPSIDELSVPQFA